MNGPIVLGAGLALAAASSSSSKVKYRELLRGVHPAIVGLYDKWSVEGTHVIAIAPAGTSWAYPGGLRLDSGTQADAFVSGLSGAADLSSTPHGRGGAGDSWPDGFDPFRGFDDAGQLPGAELLMRVFGEWAERQVINGWRIRWGGRFSRPDLPHVELADWQSLPFPPPDYGTP